MNSGTYFKLSCPACQTKRTVVVLSAEETLRCESCQGPLQPDVETQSVAEVACPRCEFEGTATSDTCPLCGEAFGTIQ